MEILDAGFRRFYGEGFSRWTKDKVVALIALPGTSNNIDDAEIQHIFQILESRGLIRLIRADDCYLEVLRD